MERSKIIIRTSIIGIVVNIILVAFKMVIGVLCNSIAIILDAVNNLGDALSSIITIVGTKLAGKAPDKKHPYGYGRIEYLTSVLIAVIVLTAGITSLKESALKIIHPTSADYSFVSLLIIAVAVVAKFLCGKYVKGVGEKINAQSLIASGSDAFFDSILSFATLVAAGISMAFGISLEGYLGVIISIIIIKAGMEMLLETLNSIIGVRTDRELSDAIKAQVREVEGVRGAYDLTLHNYGPTEIMGSIHVEVEDAMTACEIHHLTHKIVKKIVDEFGIVLTVGIYASNNTEEAAVGMRRKIEKVIEKHKEILSMHGFYADAASGVVTFDIVVDFGANSTEIRSQVIKELKKMCPEYEFVVSIDTSYTDE